jgi:hypothetical protein
MYSEFKGNLTTAYTHPLSMGGASNTHYGGNAETCFLLLVLGHEDFPI